MKQFLVVIFCTFLLNGSVKAQDSEHLWGAVFLNAKMNDKWSLIGDFQWRSKHSSLETASIIFRPGISYQVSKHLSVSGGYANIPTSIGNKLFSEDRTFGQLIINHTKPVLAKSKTSFTHRLRLEQRWVHNGLSDHIYSNRGRYFLRTITPLFKPSLSDKSFFLSIQNEVFLNFKGKNFDQNRAYFAAGYRFHSKLDGEMGYMRINTGKQSSRNILQFATYLRL